MDDQDIVSLRRTFASDAPIWDLQDALLDGAACRFDPELHDGPAGPETSEQTMAREDVAVDVCRSCPVLATCETYIARVQPVSGVWAGSTATARALHRSILTGGQPGAGKSFTEAVA
jgi:Transcription factor WhiB